MLELYVANAATPVLVMSEGHLEYHRPAKGEYPWRIVRRETGEVVESYAPSRRAARSKPCTPYAGSWAESAARAALLDLRG
jgi:hypothetical protein